VKIDGRDNPTEETGVIQESAEPVDDKTCPEVPTDELPSVIVVGIIPANVFVPAKVCADVVTNPRAVADALGIFNVTVLPRDTGEPEILKSVPEVPLLTVIEEFCRFAFGIFVGRSATTIARKVGVPEDPFGPAKIEFADSDAKVAVRDPLLVIGETVTVKIPGKDKPTEVTDPAAAEIHCVFNPVEDKTCPEDPAVPVLS